MFLVKGVLKIYSKFTGEHTCWSVISINVQSNFIEITLRHGCSPVNLQHIFRTPFTKNTCERLLLKLELAEECVRGQRSRKVVVRFYFFIRFQAFASFRKYNYRVSFNKRLSPLFQICNMSPLKEQESLCILNQGELFIWNFKTFRDCLQTSILILVEFKRINFYSSWNQQKARGFLSTSLKFA